MEFLKFALSHYVWCLAVGAAAWCWGRGLSAGLEFSSWSEQLAVRTALGLGAIGTGLYFLAVLMALQREVILATLLLGAAIGLLVPVARPRQAYRQDKVPLLERRVPLLILLAAPVVLAPLLTMALFPPVEWDATSYHLALAGEFVRGHGFVATPWLRYPHFPQFQETLFAMALALKDDLLAQLLQLLMTALTAFVLYAWGVRMGAWRAGIWAACLWLGASMVLELGPVAYIDCGCALFATLAVYACWVGRREGSDGWISLSGVFAGVAAASKYSALFFCVALLGVLAFSGMPSRRRRAPLLFALGAALLAAPWYARSWIQSGNPVFPFFPRIFGQTSWNARDLQGQMTDLLANGLPQNLAGMASAVWHLWAHHGALNAKLLGSAVDPRGLAGILGFLVLLALPRYRRLTLLVLAYLAFWFCSAPEARYLLPILPCLLIVKGLLTDRALARLPLPRKGPVLAVLTLLAGLLLLRDGRLHAGNIVSGRGAVPLNQSTREAHLERELPTHSYGAIQKLRALHGTRYSVYALFAENMFYFADGTWIGDWFGPARFSRILERLPRSRELFADLQSLGADHFLVNTSRYRVTLPRDDYFARHFQLEYRSQDVELFELRDDSEAVKAPARNAPTASRRHARNALDLPPRRTHSAGFEAGP